MADEITTPVAETTAAPTTEKAKNIIFKSLKVGQLFYMRPEKGQEQDPQQYSKQTKTDAMAVGRKDAVLKAIDAKAKVSVFYNIKDFSKRAPKVSKIAPVA